MWDRFLRSRVGGKQQTKKEKEIDTRHRTGYRKTWHHKSVGPTNKHRTAQTTKLAGRRLHRSAGRSTTRAAPDTCQDHNAGHWQGSVRIKSRTGRRGSQQQHKRPRKERTAVGLKPQASTSTAQGAEASRAATVASNQAARATSSDGLGSSTSSSRFGG